MNALWTTMSTPLMMRALLEVVLVGALAGATGVHVVLRRQSFFTLALSHATFPGVVLASIAGLSIFVGGLAFGLVFAVAVHLLSRQRAVDETSVIGVLLAGAFAFGALLQSARPGGSRDLAAFLVGSILTVTRHDIAITVAVGVVVLLVVAALHKEFILTAFDSDLGAAMGYGRHLDLVVLILATVTLVVTIPVLGTVLSVALVSVPALTARLWTDHVGTAMVFGACIGAVSGIIGLVISAQWRIAAGGAIALSCSALFLISWLATGKWRGDGAL